MLIFCPHLNNLLPDRGHGFYVPECIIRRKFTQYQKESIYSYPYKVSSAVLHPCKTVSKKSENTQQSWFGKPERSPNHLKRRFRRRATPAKRGIGPGCWPTEVGGPAGRLRAAWRAHGRKWAPSSREVGGRDDGVVSRGRSPIRRRRAWSVANGKGGG